MAWQTPVFDRTAEDLAAGRDECFFSPELLNRIEGNLEYLAERFGADVQCRTDWTGDDLLTVSGMERILGSLAAVRAAYHARPGDPDIPPMPCTGYEDINAVERLLYGMRELWEANRAAAAYAGELYAGERSLL